MRAIFKHEIRYYFHSLTAYLFCGFMLCFVGIGAMLYNINSSVANFEYVLQFICIGMVVFMPVLTMRLFADEKKQKTDQLLYSLPLKPGSIVIGKFLATLVIFLIPMCVIALYPLIFSLYGNVFLPTSYGAMVGFFFMGAAMISIGMFISTLTENQGFAAGITIPILALNYFSVQLIGLTKMEGAIPNFISNISLFERFYVFVDGVFDLTSIVFYITVIIFFLLLSVQSLEKRRYR